MDLNLYRTVGAQNRVALGDLADDVEYFSAEKDPATRVITLTPVNIISGAPNRSALGGNPLWDEDQPSL